MKKLDIETINNLKIDIINKVINLYSKWRFKNSVIYKILIALTLRYYYVSEEYENTMIYNFARYVRDNFNTLIEQADFILNFIDDSNKYEVFTFTSNNWILLIR